MLWHDFSVISPSTALRFRLLLNSLWFPFSVINCRSFSIHDQNTRVIIINLPCKLPRFPTSKQLNCTSTSYASGPCLQLLELKVDVAKNLKQVVVFICTFCTSMVNVFFLFSEICLLAIIYVRLIVFRRFLPLE